MLKIRRGLTFLVALLAFMVISVFILRMQAFKYIRNNGVNAVQPPGPTQMTPLPVVERFTSPRAILVLDVSASMKRSDPQHLQTDAVLRFYDMYTRISREILDRNQEVSRIAVVLFGTIAQVVDWNGEKNVWLKATEGNRPLFDKVMTNYLGSRGQDPRSGQKTDYLLALDEVNRLLSDSAKMNPPLVIFMTDGTYDLHPYFSSVLPLSERVRLDPAGFNRHRKIIGKFIKGGFRYLDASSTPPIFNIFKFGIRNRHFPAAIQEEIPGIIRRRLSELLDKRFYLSHMDPEVSLYWAPVFLRHGKMDNPSLVRNVLAENYTDIPHFWQRKSSFTYCREAGDLAGDFITILARWLRLKEMDIAPHSSYIQIPAHTQVFAVQVTMAKKGSHVLLSSDGREVELSGRGKSWAGMGTGSGLWKLHTDAGTIFRGKVFLRPRYDWVLSTPKWVRMAKGQETPEVDMYLYSLKTLQPVEAKHVFSNLPRSVSAYVSGKNGRPVPFNLLLVTPNSKDKVAYRAHLPFLGRGEKTLTIRVGLAAMRRANVALPQDDLIETIRLKPDITVQIRGHSGPEPGIYIRNVPRSSQYFANIWKHIDEVF